jgi:hypothetical protein
MRIVETGLRSVEISIHFSKSKVFSQDGFGSSVCSRLPSTIPLTNLYRAVKIRGAECGIEAIMLGCVTSIGGFLFGYDTVWHFRASHHAND